ncbi:hypothetical protein [Demequina iriomotensis]|uniref:hypothetical protein n=1 Tax=Demequina iriomotensis TaxID=1536641 RepID=UPI000A87D280|nr:hypothetical protein [Demequina iriomotensis]
MRVALTDVSKGRGDDALQPVTLELSSGSVTLARAETQQRPTVLGLLAAGRMHADTGVITIDGAVDPGRQRAALALVDAPVVSEPAPHVSTLAIVEEELMFAGRTATPAAARRVLETLGMTRWARTPFGNIDPADRIVLLLELAALRPGVEGVVLVSPDRHGGDPDAWWEAARGLARRGLAVLVIAGDAAAAAIAGTTVAATPDVVVDSLVEALA